MAKMLIAYFSAEGRTAQFAKEYAKRSGADIFEIVPEEVYTKADINWRNPLSRCNREHLGNKEVPVSGKIENFADYDTVCIGFPIWYGCAPNVVHTFCKDYDWTGKKVYVFATSGGGGIGKTEEKIRPHLKGANILDVREYKAAEDPAAWEKK